jgi:hypothetical protein
MARNWDDREWRDAEMKGVVSSGVRRRKRKKEEQMDLEEKERDNDNRQKQIQRQETRDKRSKLPIARKRELSSRPGARKNNERKG